MNTGHPSMYKGLLDRYLKGTFTGDTSIAVSSEGLELTYTQLDSLSNELSATIREAACLSGDSFIPIAVGCGRSAEQIISLIAIWKLNGTYMPVNLDRDVKSLPACLKPAGVRLLICHKTDLESTILNSEGCLDLIICFYSPKKWEVIKINEVVEWQSLHQAPETSKTGYLVRTSGSTGLPKTVYGRLSSLDHFITWQSDRFTDQEAVSTGWITEPTFDASFRDILLPLVKGGTVRIPPVRVRELPAALVQWVNSQEITHLHLVPSFFRILLNEIEDGFRGVPLFRKLKYVFLSGEVIQPGDVNRWHELFGRSSIIVNFYGSTETTLIRTYYEFLTQIPPGQSGVPAGRALPDTFISIANDEGVLASGQRGQVFVHTLYPTFGYLDQGRISEPWTPSSDHSNMISYPTGDTGYLDNSGNLFVVGRTDDEVKVRGVRVNLKSIEWAVYQVAAVKNAKVIFDEERGHLCLFFTANAPVDIEQGKEEMLKFLPDSHVPTTWFQLDEMPFNENGKVDVRKLKTFRSDKSRTTGQSDDFISEEEKSLATIWSEILSADIKYRSDNFFHFGGNSLNGMVLLGKIQREFKRKVRLVDIFRNPVLYQMLEVIQSAPYKGLPEIPKISDSNHYPVSAAQRRMWVLHNMERNSITYNIKRAYEISSDVDVNRLEQAFENLVVQHESLRTNFSVMEGVPVQFIRAPHEHCFKLRIIDLTAERDKNHAIRSIANNEVHHTFNLETESLLRATLIQVAQGKCVLLLNLHHIVSDGWSMELLMRTLISDYSWAGINKPGNQPSIQYRDFAAWQNQLISSGRLDSQKTYWLRELSGDLPKVEIPTDKSRAAIKTYDGQPVYFTLDQVVKEQIGALCSRLDVSLFMFLLSVTKLLLYKYSGQRDLIIGSPVAGREHPSLTNLIGFFVNTVALRTAIDPDASFESYLMHVKDKVLDGFDRQSYPFDQLIEDLDLPRDAGRSPLFDITFQVLNVEFWEDTTDSELKIKPFIADWERSQFDLSFFFKERKSDIFGLIEFNTNLFNRDRIVRLISHFNTLLGEVLAHIDRPVRSLNYLSAQERKTLLYDFNENSVVWKNKRTVLELIKPETRSDIALTGGKKELSYDSLLTLQERIAGFIAGQGLRQEIIAVLSQDRSSILPAMLGIMASGNIYLPLDPGHPLDRMLESLVGLGVKIIIYDLEHSIRADKLIWELETVCGSLCMDSLEYNDFVPAGGELMRKDLWNYVGVSAEDEIQGGGWTSSYTGLPFSKEEMEEYAENALFKIMPHINSNSRVLEIGCSSGITLLKVAPVVNYYLGVDLSAEILRNTQQSVNEAGLDNVKLLELYAHELHLLEEGDFDVVIINSVIQSFASYNYFRDVLKKILARMAPHATLFIGDIQDIRLRREMISSLRTYSQRNQDQKYRTKLIWDDELFFHPQYFKDLVYDFPELITFEFSKKKGQLVNELTLFRYDLIIRVAKDQLDKPGGLRSKWRLGIADIAAGEQSQLPSLSEEDTAYIIFTSGTTGVPKGVEISHGALANQVMGFHEVSQQRLNSNDRFLLTSRITFDVSVLEMFLGLSVAGTLIELDIDKPTGADVFVETIHEFKVSWAYLPAALLSNIFEKFRELGNPLSLRNLLVGVEPIKFNVLEFIHSNYPEIMIVNGYGPTEATVVSTFYPFNPNDEYERVPIGRPMNGYEIFVLDEYLDPAGIGIPGQIAIAGRGLAKGYRNRKSLSDEKFVFLDKLDRRVYLTGDVAFWDNSGKLNFIGRNDRQVKHNGYRIELSDIDAQILKFPAVQSALTLIVPVDENLQQLVSYVEGAPSLDEGEMKRFLSAILPSYMIPNRIMPVDKFPLTSHGKIDLAQLNKLLTSPNARSGNFVGPSTETEVVLHRLFCSILNREDLGIDDNFFDLGGHSLLATRFITKAAKEAGVDIQLVDVFTHPTVRQLASRVKQYDTENLEIKKIREDQRGIYPASYGQERLWVIDQLNPDDSSIRSAYNMVGLFRVEGDLQAEILQKAIQLLIVRHESLRTNFIEIEGKPRQVIHAHRTFSLDFLELKTDGAAGEILAIVDELASKPFDLETELLFKVFVIRGIGVTYAVTVMHHIISDGWSMHRFSLELSDAIALIKNGKTRMPELPIQYKDYSAWIKNRVKTFTDAKAYWESLLSEMQEPTVVPGDFKRPSWRTFNGDTIKIELSEEDTALIDKYCSTNSITLFSLLSASLHVLIHRCSGLDTITTGSPVSGRNHPMLEDQIGFYLNNIVVRTKLNGNLEFGEYVKSVQQQLTSALHYQEYPFDLLVENINLENNPAHAPFFDIYLALQNNDAPILNFVEFEFHEIPIDRKVSRFDLNFMVSQSDRLKLTLQFNTDLYRKDTAASLIGAYRNILLNVINTQIPIRDIQLLNAGELHHLIDMPSANLVNSSGALPCLKPSNLVEAFRNTVEKHPERIALVEGDSEWTYKELDYASSNLAWQLIGKKNNPEIPIALDIERGIARVIAIIAVLKSGSPFLPLDPNLPRERKRYQLNNANCALLVSQSDDSFSGVETVPVSFSTSPVDSPGTSVSGDHIAYVLYTSGTTGNPKGVQVTHRNVLSLLLEDPVIDISHRDVWTLFHQYYFDFSVWEMWGALLYGGKLVVLSDDEVRDLNTFSEIIQVQGVTILNQTPMVFYLVKELLINKYEERDLQLRKVIFGGDKLAPASLIDFAEQFPSIDLINMYGITETTIHVTAKLLDAGSLAGGVSNIGRAIPSLSVYIIDQYGNLLPKGIPGQLVVAGKGVSRGYLNDSDQTAKKFCTLPFMEGKTTYLSGDKARWLPNDELEYLGRIDHQLKIRGHRVEAAEIEFALEKSEWVQTAIVLKADDSGDERLYAFVEPIAEIRLRMEARRLFPDLQLTQLPNGMTVFHMNESETQFMYKEIVEDDGYHLRNLDIGADSVIVDAGANIGMFTLFSSSLWPTARIYAFEPIPKIFTCLQANVHLLNSKNISVFNQGLSDIDGELELTYYPFNTVMSGAGEFDREILQSYLREQYASEDSNGHEEIELVVDEALEGIRLSCPVRSVSSLIEANELDKIDLLKVDVEDWEEQIIRGVSARHWPIIMNVIAEVHDRDGRLTFIRDFFIEKGFEVQVVQTRFLASTALYNVVARKKVVAANNLNEQYKHFTVQKILPENLQSLVSSIRTTVQDQLPSYMVPDEIIVLENLPITRNGKTDRNKLLEQAKQTSMAGESVIAELSRRGKIVIATLENVLKKEVGIEDNFFQSGGNSLNATRVVNRVREALSIDLKVRDLFKNPAVKDLIGYIDSLNVSTIPGLTKTRRKEFYPVTHAQYQILASESIKGEDTAVYNMTGGMKLDGNLHIDLLEDTFRLIIERYEILRTSFHFQDGEFVQRIHPQANVPFRVIEVQQISEQFCKAKLEDLDRIPFRLDEVPLFRVELYVGPRQQYFLVLVMHHIISDGWSMTILNNEVAKIYNSLAERSVPDTGPLNFQFKDYTDWHTALLGNVEWLGNQKAFWKNELINAPVLELPYDYKTTGVRSFSGRTVTRILKEWGNIQQMLSKLILTDFSFLLASVHTFLARTCGQDDLVIGSPVAGRPLAQLEDQLGFFVNTIPIRLKSREDLSVRDFIYTVQQKFTELMDYQLLPYDQIMEAGRSGIDSKPLVNVAMIYQNNDRMNAKMNGISETRVEADFEGSIFDLVFIFSTSADDLVLKLQYNDGLFNAQTAEEIGNLLLETISDFSSSMDRPLADITIQ